MRRGGCAEGLPCDPHRSASCHPCAQHPAASTWPTVRRPRDQSFGTRLREQARELLALAVSEFDLKVAQLRREAVLTLVVGRSDQPSRNPVAAARVVSAMPRCSGRTALAVRERACWLFTCWPRRALRLPGTGQCRKRRDLPGCAGSSSAVPASSLRRSPRPSPAASRTRALPP